MPLEVAQHLRATFCAHEWLAAHLDMQINEVLVMYLDVAEIYRPASPPDVSPCKGILSSYSFLFLGTPGHYAMRAYSCWCPACSRVRGRGHGAVSRGACLDVPGCTRSKLTVWREDKFTVRPADGQRERDKRTAETRAKELPKAKPGKWGCVQACELWSTKEDVHLRPGHHWLFEVTTSTSTRTHRTDAHLLIGRTPLSSWATRATALASRRFPTARRNLRWQHASG